MEKKRLIKKKERLITASSLLLAPLKLILIITHTHTNEQTLHKLFFNFCYPSLAIEKERTPSPLKTHTHMQKKKLQKN